jgi:hypothetical protein
MSEAAAEVTTDGNEGGQTSTAEKFAPITSQEDLDRLVGDRVKRERSKYADYDDLKVKASQLDQLAEASQTETEKATSRATKAETERDDARAEALRLRIAVENGISIEDADLFLTGKDEESLRAQAKRLSDREADRKKNGNRVTAEGGNPNPKTSTSVAEFARGMFGDT